MTSITIQKADLRAILTTHVVDCYEQFDEEQRLALVTGLANRLACQMTLRDLRAWHNKIVINDAINRITSEIEESPERN